MKLLPSPLARYGIETPKVPARAAIKDPCAGMTKLERRYAGYLATLQAAGEVVWFEYEAIRLRIGHDAFYTPDFLVQLPSGLLELHETKGFMREAAGVRLAAVAERYPFRVLLVREVEGRWDIQEVKP